MDQQINNFSENDTMIILYKFDDFGLLNKLINFGLFDKVIGRMIYTYDEKSFLEKIQENSKDSSLYDKFSKKEKFEDLCIVVLKDGYLPISVEKRIDRVLPEGSIIDAFRDFKNENFYVSTFTYQYFEGTTTDKIDDLPKNVKEFRNIALSLADLYEKKNRNYGDSFGKSLEKYGKISALTRISDKFNRLENGILSKDFDPDDESLEDTLLDMASYCIMTSMAFREMTNESHS